MSPETAERQDCSDAWNLYQAPLAMVSDGVLIADATRRGWPIRFCNPAYENITGYSRAEILGQSCPALKRRIYNLQDAATKSALRDVRAALQDQRACQVVLKGRRKDGACFWSELHLAPVRDVRGRATHFIGVHTDITGRKNAEEELHRIRRDLEWRATGRTAELAKLNELFYEEILERRRTENALREAESRYRSIFENAVEGMYQSTPEGHYLSVNPALARLYGYSSPEALINSVQDIASQIYDDPKVREVFKRLMDAHGEVRGLEYKVRCVNGSFLWISECARAVRNHRGEILYYEGTIQDITVRKLAEAEKANLEAQLRQAQKMEAIGTLAGGIAHDFNNILGIIMGYSELAAVDLLPQAATAKYLAQVASAAQRAKELVSQILTFSRQGSPERKTLRLSPLIKESLKLLRASLPSTITIQQDLRARDDRILTDPTQIHQVLMNLCTNAAYAMRGKGGTLAVSLDEVPIPEGRSQTYTGLEPGSYLRLTVADTGHGMDPATVERIFDPFFTTKPVGEGTGLGLSVVHGIVKSHGGEIKVKSELGRGTVFEIFLPRANQADDAYPTSKPKLIGGSERILVVDDEPALVDAIKARLEHLGYQVRGVSSSLDALSAFSSNPGDFDVVLADLTMPHMTGIELAQALFRVRSSLPFILCTGYLQQATEAAAKKAGIAHIITKPIGFAELSQIIRTAIDGSITGPERESVPRNQAQATVAF